MSTLSKATVILGVAAIGALVVSGEAYAQRKEAGARTPYHAYLAGNCLPGSNFCTIDSQVVPADAVLEIQRVACQGWHGSDTPPNFVTIGELRTADNAYIGRIDFLETRYTRVNTNSVWYISEQTMVRIPANHKYRISLNSASTGVGSYGCTLSGYLEQ